MDADRDHPWGPALPAGRPLVVDRVAHERHAVVDDHHLLVVRPAYRVLIVQMEVNPPVLLPRQIENGKQLTFQGVDDGKIPLQDMHVQAFSPLDQGVHEIPEHGGQTFSFPFLEKPGPAVDIPARNQYGLLGSRRRACEGIEVGGRIHQEGHSFRLQDPPAIPPCLKNGFHETALRND